MKRIKLSIFCIFLLFAFAIQAQSNLAPPPPAWGPAGYTDVRYYYLPDVESYYDIYASQFVCYINGEWLHKNRLSNPNKNYDLYDGYKIVMEDYVGSAPYQFFQDQKLKYPVGYRGAEQKTIGEKPVDGKSGKKNK
jgi:hypothetical protein